MPNDTPVIVRFTGPVGSGKSVLMSFIQAMLDANGIGYQSFDEEHKLIVDIKPFLKNRKLPNEQA